MAVNSSSYHLYDNQERMYPSYTELGEGYGDMFPPLEGAIYVESNDISTPGVSLNVDFVARCTGGHFTKNITYIGVQIRFYNKVNNLWGSRNSVYSGIMKIRGQSDTTMWNSGYNGIRPPYGMIYGTGSIYHGMNKLTNSMVGGVLQNMTYSEAQIYIISDYPQYHQWYTASTANSSGAYYTYVYPEIWGVRYLSNNGKFNASNNHQPPTVRSNFTGYRYQKIDPGANRNNLLHINWTTGVGETHYQLKVWMGNNAVREDKVFYWPADGRTNDGAINEVQNALLGIPDIQTDYQLREGWPPRYDANFSYNGGNWNIVKGAGKKSNGTNWSVF